MSLFMSKRRDLIVGGLLMTLTIKDSKLESLRIGDYYYSTNDPLAKSFSKDFLDFLAKQDGRMPINLENPIFRNNTQISKIVDKQKIMLKRGISKHLRELFDKDSIKNMKHLASSGLIENEKDLNNIKAALEKPRGLGGMLYKSMKAIVEFSAKDTIEKLKPKEVDMQNFTTKVLNDEKEVESSSKEPSTEELFQMTMLEFMKTLSENQKNMQEAQLQFMKEMKNQSSRSEAKAETKENASANKEAVKDSKASTKKTANEPKEASFVPTVDFKSEEVKNDILSKWKESKDANEKMEDASIEYLNINTVRFNGISTAKLDKWKSNELSKEKSTLTPEIADSYIAKNMHYAEVLEKIGVLTQVKPGEFEFADSGKKEILYKNFKEEINVINRLVNGSAKAKVVADKTSTPSVDYKARFDEFVKKNPQLVEKRDIENFNKFYENINNQGHPKDILEGELASYVDGFIINKENKFKADAKEVQETDFDPNAGFAEMARASADMKVGGKNLSNEDVNSEEKQKEYDAIIAEQLEKNKKEQEQSLKDNTPNPS